MSEKIWERLPVEDDDAWGAFSGYLGMHPRERSVKRAGSYGTARKTAWYRDHNWEDRCAAYDKHMFAIVQKEREELFKRSAKEMAQEHASMLADVRDLGARELAKWNEASRLSDVPGMGGTKLKDVVKIVETAIKLQRLVNGETTENVGGGLDLTKLSEEEAETLFALMQKANAPDDGTEH